MSQKVYDNTTNAEIIVFEILDEIIDNKPELYLHSSNKEIKILSVAIGSLNANCPICFLEVISTRAVLSCGILLEHLELTLALISLFLVFPGIILYKLEKTGEAH